MINKKISILFGQSQILFTHRKFIWLCSCYSLTLYAHRYLENSAWSQIIVGGSNFDELLGAIFRFSFLKILLILLFM